ncbi:MAG: dodecin domain-containing protein [Planctomycetes bacterium]|mgnify:FL=1|nr:dodecin domain-containing protein [Planctomycetota bacterium]
MAVARVTEIVASSDKSFQDAVERGVERASRTLRGMTGLKVIEQKAKIVNGAITEYRVYLAITFVLDD